MPDKETADTQQSPDDGYFPAPSEYDPHLSVAQWREILRDPELTTPDTLAMLATMLRLGGEATCAELARHGDKSAWHYNALGMNLAGGSVRNAMSRRTRPATEPYIISSPFGGAGAMDTRIMSGACAMNCGRRLPIWRATRRLRTFPRQGHAT